MLIFKKKKEEGIMQNQLLTLQKVLDENGKVISNAYSKTENFIYNREDIKANKFRIKEWDFYQVSNNDCVLQLTIGHASYVGICDITFYELATGKTMQTNYIKPFVFDKWNLSKKVFFDNVLEVKTEKYHIRFDSKGDKRHLTCVSQDKKHGKCEVDIELTQLNKEFLSIAIPFKEKETGFYYNNKMNCFAASGTVAFGDYKYTFKKEDSLGLIDWGRGVWPFKHEWIWGSGNAYINNKPFGFNIGWGFGNTSEATENSIFYDGVMHKLDRIKSSFGSNTNYMSECSFSETDKRFEVTFTPVYNHHTDINLLFARKQCHQVFGRWNGYAVLDNGDKIEIKDVMAFIEHCTNKW